MDCIFCKIIAGELPTSKIYEDESLFAFLNINPVHKGHALLIPKKHVSTIFDADDALLEHLAVTLKKLAGSIMKTVGAQGCTISSNNGAGQQIPHLHWHLIPRFTDDNLTDWPHGSYASLEEKEAIAEMIRDSLSTL